LARLVLGAFLWASLQGPRAVLWQVRERELRSLALLPAVLTVVCGAGLLVGAVLAAGALTGLLSREAHGFGEAGLRLLLQALLTGVLMLAATFLAWHLQSAIAAAMYERMALYVQRHVLGESPLPAIGTVEVLKRTLRSVFPRVRSLVAWALTALAGLGLVLVPVVGPVLAVGAQVAIAALFLAHGTITDNRERLGLPRRFLLAEPALVLGLALALTPLVLVPPLLLVFGGPVAIAGAFVALGSAARRAEPLATDAAGR
jgi:uncharacterized protein involved in cysteine biosynthesis